jgi:hypothetical protein
MICRQYVLGGTLVIFRQFSQAIRLEYLTHLDSCRAILKKGCDVLT